MAKYQSICDTLLKSSVLFLFLVSSGFSVDERFFYQSTNGEFDFDVALLRSDYDGHRVHKRDVASTSTTIPPPITSATIMNKTTNNAILTKNLGENGTGQRKNVSSNATVPKNQLTETKNSTINLNTTKLNTTDNDHIPFTLTGFDDPLTSKFNKTLAANNITVARNDSHFYYNSTFKTDPLTAHQHWVDFTNNSNVTVSDLLSHSHRRAATVKLSFDFPFYGHIIKTVTIATGGFLYTGDYVHSWLAATQYIAPLMANFDTSMSNDSYVMYLDNGTAFTVQWERVILQDKPEDGQFTFQVTLHSNGDIVFVYRNVPIIIENIHDDYHPVKVGLSDAYIMDRTIFFVRRKTIYEYHRVNFPKEDIKNWTMIYLKALPTCLDSKDCGTCLGTKLDNFQCIWCPTLNRCSNGFDRNRQEWLTKQCDKKNLMNATMCTQINPTEVANVDEVDPYNPFADPHNKPREFYDSSKLSHEKDTVKMSVSSIVAILFLISMFSGMGLWLFYAYRNPHTTSGQMLIRYRPSQWRWRRGEARYTAATIHM